MQAVLALHACGGGALIVDADDGGNDKNFVQSKLPMEFF